MKRQALPSQKLKNWTVVALAALVIYEVVGNWWNNSIRTFTLLSETVSPSEKYKAVLFTQDCGQLCEYENDVAIIGVGDVANADTNRVFRSYPSKGIDKVRELGEDLTTVVHQPWIDYPIWTSVKWLDDCHLLVTYDENTEAAEAERRVTVGWLLFGREHIAVSYKKAK